jgi:hypothetical protein
MLDILKTNEKMFLQSRNYVLKSQIFGRNQNSEDKMEINSTKFIPSIYN